MSYEIRTDLAVETSERIFQNSKGVHGVRVEERENTKEDIKTTIVYIESENGSKAMGKSQGTYITIEAPEVLEADERYLNKVAETMVVQMKELLPDKEDLSILVVGLGNQNITPDALGPWTVEQIHITRHLIMAYGREYLEGDGACQISGLIPGVMATTGMETLEIIQGVVEKTKPDALIVVDALAARGLRRLGRTIQMTDAGIHPGSGVGNHREGITKETLGIPVIGIGVPTVVDAATIVYDGIEHLVQCLEPEERDEFLEEMLTPQLRCMFVTPRDVDESVRILSELISKSIDMLSK